MMHNCSFWVSFEKWFQPSLPFKCFEICSINHRFWDMFNKSQVFDKTISTTQYFKWTHWRKILINTMTQTFMSLKTSSYLHLYSNSYGRISLTQCLLLTWVWVGSCCHWLNGCHLILWRKWQGSTEVNSSAGGQDLKKKLINLNLNRLSKSHKFGHSICLSWRA